MNEKTEKLKEILSDEALLMACFDAENEEAVQKLLADKGVELSIEEIRDAGELLRIAAEGTFTPEEIGRIAKGELSEDELENVAGGGEPDFSKAAQWSMIKKCTGGAFAFLAVVYGSAIIAANWDSVKSGVTTAYNWVADKVTSRW